MLRFQCPCGQRLQARDDCRGVDVACPRCGATIIAGGRPEPANGPATPATPAGPARLWIAGAVVVLLAGGAAWLSGLFDGVSAPTGEAARTLERERLKRMAAGLEAYQEAHDFQMPPADGKGKGLSWRVHILPHVGAQGLFKRFNLEEAWDGPTNLPLLSEMPDLYRRPGDAGRDGLTPYVAVRKDTLDFPPGGAFVVVASRPERWTEPGVLDLDEPGLAARLDFRFGKAHAVFRGGEIREAAREPEETLRAALAGEGPP